MGRRAGFQWSGGLALSGPSPTPAQPGVADDLVEDEPWTYGLRLSGMLRAGAGGIS
jgi:hypothetical protein